MSIRSAYYDQMEQRNIRSVNMTSIGKENRSSQCYLIKNSKGEGGVGGVEIYPLPNSKQVDRVYYLKLSSHNYVVRKKNYNGKDSGRKRGTAGRFESSQ